MADDKRDAMLKTRVRREFLERFKEGRCEGGSRARRERVAAARSPLMRQQARG